MKKIYVLFQDIAGGRLFIEETEDDDFTYQELGGCYANNIFESEDENEVLRKYDEIIKSETIYVVARGCWQESQQSDGCSPAGHQRPACFARKVCQQVCGTYSTAVCAL